MSVMLLASVRLLAVGFTPTDGGFVVNLKPEDKILISVWIDKDKDGDEDPGEEYFVGNYTRYTGDDYFTYTNKDKDSLDYNGRYLKLFRQAADATEPSEMSVWTVDTALTRICPSNISGLTKNENYALGGISYTIWNDDKTLRTEHHAKDRFRFYGHLESDIRNSMLCDVVFVIPTGRSTITSFDPNKTLNHKNEAGVEDQDAQGRFDGLTGTGFLGMTYREVYMMVIPRYNSPDTYTNAAVVTFNTTTKDMSLSSGAGTIKPGRAAYAYADNKHKPTPRTIFRLYILNDPINSCGEYFFAYDEQNTLKYRQSNTMGDSTAKKKIYTMDRMFCMDRVGSTQYYRTGYMNVPEPDSAYYYVGYNNDYKAEATEEKMGNPGAFSQFEKIRTLPMKDLAGKYAPAGAYGRMVVDTTSTDYNLGVKFKPAGYMLKVSTGKNVRMKPNADSTVWTTQDMWTIDGSWTGHTIKATLMTGPEFSEEDPGADVAEWSVPVEGKDVPVKDRDDLTPAGLSGYAQITVTDATTNGNIVFLPANLGKHLHYSNNGFLGDTVPDQYPLGESDEVTIQAPRIKAGYTFLGWSKNANGSGDTIHIGDTYEIQTAADTLYALATYNGTLQVAISFMQGDKRYFLTHPNSSAPRYARARHFENWENTWQGMENAENKDPNYVSTFEVRHPSNEVKAYDVAHIAVADRHLFDGEMCLDPRRYPMKGYEDSLVFYEYFAPAKDEFLGLYYQAPNTILANNTWAGLFVTTSGLTTTGWPDYKTPYIPSAKLKSERYVEEDDPENHPDSLTLKLRSNSDKPWVYYDPTKNQFDGVALEKDATEFEISAVVVADAHYVVIPDTTEEWKEQITFGYHKNEHIIEPVWSKLIGKQFLACMMVGGDTTYFHPNRKKIYTTPQELYLSSDFRLSQNFEFIRDSRVATAISEGDSVMRQETSDYWHNDIVSGFNSPMNIKNKAGEYIDIVDTFRIRLSHGGISKIKEYRGRWKKVDEGDGLTVSADGSSRHRDVIVTTKTYHYADTTTHLELTPEFESYSIGPLVNQNTTINFTLTNVTTHTLKDRENNTIRTEIIGTPDTIKSGWSMYKGEGTDYCQLRNDTDMHITTAAEQHLILTVIDENTTGVNYDTLIVKKIKVGDVDKTVDVRVPLVQVALQGNELIWSVEDDGERYFIMAGSGGLIFRQFTQRESTLYKHNKTDVLIKGAKNAANDDDGYITPWTYAYPDKTNHPDQLTLFAESPVSKYFAVSGTPGTPGVGDAATTLTYTIERTYTNDNANYEEVVKLNIGGADDGWLKFSNGALTLTDYEHASTFYWGYLQQEYSLLNNGTYPSQNEAVFGYNSAASTSIQTRYKAYREYTMLLNNQQVDLCREEETDIADLKNGSLDWKITYSITKTDDSRFDANASGLGISTTESTLVTTIAPVSATSPKGVQIAGTYVDIVDTMVVTLSTTATHTYRFKGDWSGYNSISDANLKIPLVRKTYHDVPYDSLVCMIIKGQMGYTFPASLTPADDGDDVHTFRLSTLRRTGTHVVDADGNIVDVQSPTEAFVNTSGAVHLSDKDLAEVRLVDEYGNTPTWCEIQSKGDTTITVKCLANGIRAPRSANIYLAYIVMVDHDNNPATDKVMHFVNAKLTVSQPSLFASGSNQVLVHSSGASGDEPMANGMQQVHANRRIIYYYPDEDVELPVRERAFYGWWRWYRESANPSQVEADIPDSDWRKKPENTGRYNNAFKTIGDTIWNDPEDHDKGYKVVTMGRYTVFHYKSRDYNNKANPPAKNPRIAPPSTEYGGRPYRTDTIAVDISNYYDKLPMSVKDKNQVDVAMLDTMREIPEPTLSIREVFELRPWTEMAETLEHYKDTIGQEHSKYRNMKYMEDHVMMAPIGNALLLRTEQRYNLANLESQGFSDSQLGYYMRDDNWSTWSADAARQDSMIWLGGWDADCKWYFFDPSDSTYSECTYSLTKENDFLSVPAKTSISAGHEFDTVYYCLRARSRVTTGIEPDYSDDYTTDGDYWFNICRYKIIYHNPDKYGPVKETTNKGVTKAIITNTEIEQRYDVLERLNFDYIQPGKNYHVYPHPLPWADASYGYTYPETSDLPHNRYHDESDFPNHGEYGLINRIPYSTYWHKMEQHGGAENGYMIYCDGMASAGQVAALSLQTKLCEGQKMFFSAYVGNPSSQKGKSNPNFIFSVQGSTDGSDWDDITSYMTGDIQPSNQWYQIYFPILQEKEYDHFRVRIYNVASSFDGNDFIIDDMCIFATKPPLIAYQASTSCMEQDKRDSLTHVIIRVDYKGITGADLNGTKVYYTIEQIKDEAHSFLKPIDGYFNSRKVDGADESKPDTLFGFVQMPAKEYMPMSEDSVFSNVDDLLKRFDETSTANPEDYDKWFRKGYVLENLEGAIRPVLYFVHAANMAPDIQYKVRMAHANEDAKAPKELMSSMCAMTSDLKVSNRMLLEINGEEQPEMTVTGMCANATYNLSLRIKSSSYIDGVAPIDENGSCINDWLLYGDTVPASSKARYGYYYADIVKMVTKILRYEGGPGISNPNQFAASLSDVSRAKMEQIQTSRGITFPEDVNPYDMLVDLVNKGFLTLYKRQITVTVNAKSSVSYVILPIIGTGSKMMDENNMEVCPYPLYIKLEPDAGVTTIPLIIGGLYRTAEEMSQPVTVLLNEQTANKRIAVKIDSIQKLTAIHSITFHSTDDPDFIEGVHSLSLRPEKIWHLDGSSNDGYYKNGDSLVLFPATAQTYPMRAGYNYTFTINMMSPTGALTEGDCRIGEIPFTIGVVPAYMRWDPKNAESNEWNKEENWLGIDEHNVPIHEEAHFVPMADTYVLIPEMTDGKPYPVLPDLDEPLTYDSVKKVNFKYNQANVVRFLPGAAMGQQQRMSYNAAVVDMAMPEGKWAFRSSPVKGMISGDLYMGRADVSGETPLWEVGAFDVDGRNYKLGGNASFWLSVYNTQTEHKADAGEVREAHTEWSKVTNAMTLPLPMAKGWAVFTRTTNGNPVVRLPKNDDIYYYYGTYGELTSHYEDDLLTKRNAVDGGNAGKLAFHPDDEYATYTLRNGVSDTVFVFGNPTMGYIDIWGFIADNSLVERFDFMDERPDGASVYTSVSKSAAEATTNLITEPKRYLPPMRAIVVKSTSATELSLKLYSNRVVTDTIPDLPTAPAPQRGGETLRKGIMTVTVKNPVSPRCVSRLLLGQGYHADIRDGEDAILTMINVTHYSNTNAPATPFNIYAVEGEYGLSIDLLDSIVNVPISIEMSNLSYEPVTQLWFTGVNNIDGQLVLYDALMGTERAIIDGICLHIETPEQNHQRRYYIRRRGFDPEHGSGGEIPTGVEPTEQYEEQAYKIIYNGNVYIIRNGHVFTMMGEKVR